MAFGLPFGLLLPLRIAQGAFALLTLALSAYGMEPAGTLRLC
jgi:hypothetical protein